MYAVGPSRARSTLRSRLGGAIDYYLTYGGAAAAASPLDGAIAGYRNLTGAAPLYGRFAYDGTRLGHGARRAAPHFLPPRSPFS